MNAILALEDGTWYQGVSAGAPGQTEGEVVFNTSMTGYQEVLTDPSYAGQIVTMTAPQIGNYGVAETDVESEKPQVAGFVMRDPSPVSSNWRSQGTLRDYLTRNNIVAIGDIDTRALTRKLRSAGVMRGIIATGSVDPAGAGREGAPDRAHGRQRPGQGRDLRGSVRLRDVARRRGDRSQLRRAAAAPRQADAARRRLRLRHQDQHPAAPGRARLQGARLSGIDAGRGSCSPGSRMAFS